LKHIGNVCMKIIPHKKQRYDTAGDWYPSKRRDYLVFYISQMENPDYEFSVFLHELIEQYLCEKRGITAKMVDAWDFAHADDPDPGSIPGCPYFEAHGFATIIEKMLIEKFGHSWSKYDQSFEKLVWREKK
jgi:hypothetical protein